MVANQRPHVAIFAVPFGTHAAPLLSLAQTLARSAPNVAFSFFNTPKSNASLSLSSSNIAIPNLNIYDVADGIPEDYVMKGQPQEEIELFLAATPGNFLKGLKEVMKARGEKITCVLSDSFLWFAGQVAEDMRVPWLSFWTSSSCSLSAHFYTDLIRRTKGTVSGGTATEISSSWLDETLTFVPGSDLIRIRDLPEGIVFGPMDTPFANLLQRMGEESPRATAVIFNSFEGLDSTVLDDLRTKFQNCLPVGPISMWASPSLEQPSDDSCLRWLDSLAHAPSSVAYISFGTVVSPKPLELVALAEGLEASGVHFVWSLKDGLRESLPAGFLERTKGKGMVVSWAPQTRVLAHVTVGAFVTHCGWNSVLESITCEVPMICRPFIGDQRLNGRMVSHVWGIGIGVEAGVLTKDAVVDGLHLLLRRDEGKKMREKVKWLKGLAKDAVGEAGTSTNNLKTLLRIVEGCQSICTTE